MQRALRRTLCLTFAATAVMATPSFAGGCRRPSIARAVRPIARAWVNPVSHARPVAARPLVRRPTIQPTVVVTPQVHRTVVQRPAIHQPVISQPIVHQSVTPSRVISRPVVSSPVVRTPAPAPTPRVPAAPPRPLPTRPQPASPVTAPASPVTAQESALDALQSILEDGLPQIPEFTPAQAVTHLAHLGTWTVRLAGNQAVQLQLDDGGTFRWTATKNGQSSVFVGNYRLDGGTLTLVRSTDGGQMSGSWVGSGNQFTFTLNGSNQSGLVFSRSGA